MSTTINQHHGGNTAGIDLPWRHWALTQQLHRIRDLILSPSLTRPIASLLLHDLSPPTPDFHDVNPEFIKMAVGYLEARLEDKRIDGFESLPIPSPSPPPKLRALQMHKVVGSPKLTRKEASQVWAALGKDLEMYEKDPRRNVRGLNRKMADHFRNALGYRLAVDKFRKRQKGDGKDKGVDAEEEDEEEEQWDYEREAELLDDEQDDEEQQPQGTKRKSSVTRVEKDPKRRRTPAVSSESEETEDEYSSGEEREGYTTDVDDSDDYSDADEDEDEPYDGANTVGNTPTPQARTKPLQPAPTPPKQTPTYTQPLLFKIRLGANRIIEKSPIPKTPQYPTNTPIRFLLNPQAPEFVSSQKVTTLSSPFTAKQVQSLAQQQLQKFRDQLRRSLSSPQFPGAPVMRSPQVPSPPPQPQIQSPPSQTYSPQPQQQLCQSPQQTYSPQPQPQHHTPQAAQQSPIQFQHSPLWQHIQHITYARCEKAKQIPQQLAPQYSLLPAQPQYQCPQSQQTYSPQPQYQCTLLQPQIHFPQRCHIPPAGQQSPIPHTQQWQLQPQVPQFQSPQPQTYPLQPQYQAPQPQTPSPHPQFHTPQAAQSSPIQPSTPLWQQIPHSPHWQSPAPPPHQPSPPATATPTHDAAPKEQPAAYARSKIQPQTASNQGSPLPTQVQTASPSLPAQSQSKGDKGHLHWRRRKGRGRGMGRDIPRGGRGNQSI